MLMETHNRQATKGPNGNFVSAGDEVESINGEADSSKFAKCCQSDRVVIRLLRRVQPAALAVPETPSTPAAPVSPGAAPATPAPLPAPTPPNSGVPFFNATPAAVPQKAPATPVQPRSLNESAVPASNGVAAAPAPEVVQREAPSVEQADAVQPSSSSTSVPDSVANGAAPLKRSPSAAEAKEIFLLKAEIEQLRRRLEGNTSQEELRTVKAERDRLRDENEALQKAASDQQALQRRRSVEAAKTGGLVKRCKSLATKLQRLVKKKKDSWTNEQRSGRRLPDRKTVFRRRGANPLRGLKMLRQPMLGCILKCSA